MDEWHNLAWYQQEWVPVAGGAALGIALIAAIVWFVDGVRKYGYSTGLDFDKTGKDTEEENE